MKIKETPARKTVHFHNGAGNIRKIKKYRHVSLLFFTILLFWPLNLGSEQIYLKAALGISAGEKVYDVWKSTTGYFDCRSLPGGGTDPALDVSFEFIFELNPNFGFSLGTGYISKRLKGSLGEFKLPYMSDFADLSYSPVFTAEVFPVYLSALYFYPVGLAARMNFQAGIGYYFGKIDCVDEDMTKSARDPQSSWNYIGWLYKSNSSTVGFQAGTGIEVDAGMNLVFFFDALYRVAEFKKFKSVSKFSSDKQQGAGSLEGGPTFFYAKRIYGDEAMGDIDYRISSVSFSGLVFRIGVKFLL